MTAPTEADFTAVTTRAKQKRHWALTATMEVDHGPLGGRLGPTLCQRGRDGGGMDQERLNANLPHGLHRRYVITALRPCRLCDEHKARRMQGRTS